MITGKPCGSEEVKFQDGITNGAAWYSVPGGMQDWNYIHSNTFELTMEIACYKYPYEKDLPEYWRLNKRSLISFMQEVIFILINNVNQNFNKLYARKSGSYLLLLS